jgi:hypothetical protein
MAVDCSTVLSYVVTLVVFIAVGVKIRLMVRVRAGFGAEGRVMGLGLDFGVGLVVMCSIMNVRWVVVVGRLVVRVL